MKPMAFKEFRGHRKNNGGGVHILIPRLRARSVGSLKWYRTTASCWLCFTLPGYCVSLEGTDNTNTAWRHQTELRSNRIWRSATLCERLALQGEKHQYFCERRLRNCLQFVSIVYFKHLMHFSTKCVKSTCNGRQSNYGLYLSILHEA